MIGIRRPLPGSGSERLPSLKPKRDLTLGGAPKVLYCIFYQIDDCSFIEGVYS